MLILTILGLAIFEIISSIDNAVINAEVLSTMRPAGRKWFASWGLLFGVFIVRGVLPWLIIWFTIPSLGPLGAFTAAFSKDTSVQRAIEHATPILLMAGGIFLVFLFLHWLFLEEKHFSLHTERYFAKQGAWFYAVVGVLLLTLVKISLSYNTLMALSAVAGSTIFFIVHGFKQSAEAEEEELLHTDKSDVSKIFYLEVIDGVFSIDAVLGAFAFTFSIPLILLGNGLGALVVRHFTLQNVESIKKYAYLKNGAMYSILFLGFFMLLESFGYNIPGYASPLITIIVVSYFLYRSILKNRKIRT